jgi:predicted PurR-regulated permease PerM
MNFGQSLGFLCLLISLYILWQIRQLLLLIFTAIIFAVALNRLVKFLLQYNLRRFSLSRVQAVGIIICGFFTLIYIFFLLIVPPFVEQFRLLLELIPTIIDKINEFIISLNFLNQGFPIIPNLSDILDNSQEFTTDLFRNFLQIFSNFFGVMLQIIFVFVLTLMFLLNPPLYRLSLLKLFPSFYRNRTQDIFDKTEIAIVSWLNGILINCIFIGTLSGIGLAILQVKLVLVHALLAGILNFIPNIGPAMSVVFPIMIAVLDSPWKIVAIFIWYFIIQNIESYWLTPKVMAEKVSLLPAVTLFSQVFFAQSFGLLGLLLALPLTVVAKIWIEEVLFQDILDQWGKSNSELRT